MLLHRIVKVISLALLLSFSSQLLAESLSDEQRTLIWQKVEAYATCIQDRSQLKPVTSEGDVDAIAEDCRDVRNELQEAAPGRNIADKVDSKMKQRVAG